MSYSHQFIDGSHSALPVGKVVCVGRNYVEHARELNNPVPSMPLLFMKPATALNAIREPIRIPVYANDCQHELELAVLIGKKLSSAAFNEAQHAVAGYGLALDLTLRDIQQQLKQQGQPWERAKAFDGSCPITPFIKSEAIDNPQQLEFSLSLNGITKQRGNTQNMVWPIYELLAHISDYFTLMPGDVVLTGTPAGVGRLENGDELILELERQYIFTGKVMA